MGWTRCGVHVPNVKEGVDWFHLAQLESIQIWTWPLIDVPNPMCMCKVLPIRRLCSKVTILVVQNFRKVTNPHKVCVLDDNYLELAVNLLNKVLSIKVLHQFMLKQ
jgi:hypothetical protein